MMHELYFIPNDIILLHAMVLQSIELVEYVWYTDVASKAEFFVE